MDFHVFTYEIGYTVKITITLNQDSVGFFKEIAQKEHVSYQQLIRVDKAIILGVLRKLEIYDIRVCTLTDLRELAQSNTQKKLTVLQNIVENSETASEKLTMEDYAKMASQFDQITTDSLNPEEKELFANELAKILSTKEEKREIGLFATTREELVKLVEEALGERVKDKSYGM